MTKQYTRHVLLPLIIGGLLYIIFRDKGLIMFAWFDIVGLIDTINLTRQLTIAYHDMLPTWTTFSLPNALWTYSLTMFMVINWRHRFDKSSAVWILLGPTIAISSELAQGLGVLNGTFDMIDLLLCTGASILAIIKIKHFDFKILNNDKKDLITY